MVTYGYLASATMFNVCISNIVKRKENYSHMYEYHQRLLYYIAWQLCFKMAATLAHIENEETDHNIVYSMYIYIYILLIKHG